MFVLQKPDVEHQLFSSSISSDYLKHYALDPVYICDTRTHEPGHNWIRTCYSESPLPEATMSQKSDHFLPLSSKHEHNGHPKQKNSTSIKVNPPILELLKLCVDLVNVDVLPRDVVVAVDGVDDIVVQAVQLLQQDQFLLDLQQARVFRHLQAKQLLTPRVRGVFADERVEDVLVDDQFVGSFPRWHTWYHGSILEENGAFNYKIHMDKASDAC